MSVFAAIRRKGVLWIWQAPRWSDKMADASYDFLVKGSIPFMKQKGNTCWAACGAMMHGWRNQMSTTLAAVVQYAGNPYIDYLKKQKAIPLDEIDSFGYAMDMKRLASRSFSDYQIYNLMSSRGTPLMICIRQKGATGHHFYVVTRMYTDEDGGWNVLLNDPNRSEGDTAYFFDDLYEEMERAASGVDKQILYY
jgi:hypothetical protein